MNHMSNLKDALDIPDTQSERDERRLAIQRVGVKDVRYPIELRIGKTVLPTVAQWDLDVKRSVAGGLQLSDRFRRARPALKRCQLNREAWISPWQHIDVSGEWKLRFDGTRQRRHVRG